MSLPKIMIAAVVALTLLSLVVWQVFFSTGTSTGAPSALPQASKENLISSGPFQLLVEVNPSTPKVGKNTVTIHVRDAVGNLVSGAKVQADAVMAAMGAMPAMHAPAEIEETSPGVYEGDFHIAMAGEWPLHVEVEHVERETDSDQKMKVTFDLATGREGIRRETALFSSQGENMQAQGRGMGAIRVEGKFRQLIGVKTAAVMMMPFIRELRLVGQVKVDETRVSEISLKFDGWIGELNADYVGKEINKNEALFTVYSPELVSAQAEFLASQRLSNDRSGNRNLLETARSRLLLWDMKTEQIELLSNRETPENYLPYLAPQSGVIIDSQIRKGGAVKQGQTLLTIADLSTLWIEAEVYEADLPYVETGTPVTVVLSHLPGEVMEAVVDYVYPTLDLSTRTARIRVIVPNPDGGLKPGMFADVRLSSDQGRRLLVPEESVIFAGEKRIVFVDIGEGILVPTAIKTGLYNGEFIEVLDGLQMGDVIVTSGNFLLAAESKLKAGIELWQ